jgi:hypothetical protein
MKKNAQVVEQINNTPIIDANISCESHHSLNGCLPTIKAPK